MFLDPLKRGTKYGGPRPLDARTALVYDHGTVAAMEWIQTIPLKLDTERARLSAGA